MTLTSERIQKLYDRIGPRYDWVDFYESAARAAALNGLGLAPGQIVLNAGAGTGKLLTQIDQSIFASSFWVGLDLSPVMARLAYQRSPGAVLVSDVRRLPLGTKSVDRIFAAYVLDLLPYADIEQTLIGFARVLKPGGRLAVLSLTEGVDRVSRSLIGAWKWLFDRAPALCGGCRPLQLQALVEATGLQIDHRQVIVEWGVPSEVVIAAKLPSA